MTCPNVLNVMLAKSPFSVLFFKFQNFDLTNLIREHVIRLISSPYSLFTNKLALNQAIITTIRFLTYRTDGQFFFHFG